MIDTSKITKLDQTLIAIPVLNRVQAFFEDPKNQKEFEVWLKNRKVNQKIAS